MNKPSISFTLDSEDRRDELKEYAKVRGFTSIGALARFALYQYVNRYPIKKVHGRTTSSDSERK